jgi:hypothetical protein
MPRRDSRRGDLQTADYWRDDRRVVPNYDAYLVSNKWDGTAPVPPTPRLQAFSIRVLGLETFVADSFVKMM